MTSQFLLLDYPLKAWRAEPNTCQIKAQAAEASVLMHPTCLLGPALDGSAAWSITRSVEGQDADQVGRVASQILEFDAILWQEECFHPFSFILPLSLPKIDLWG